MQYRELAELITNELSEESTAEFATDRIEDILEDYFRFNEKDKE